MEFQRQPLHSVETQRQEPASGSLFRVASRLGAAASGADGVAQRVQAAIGNKHYTLRQWRKLDPVPVWNTATDRFDDSFEPGTGGHRATDIISDGPLTSLEGHLRELRAARGPYETLDKMIAEVAGSDLRFSFLTAASASAFAHRDTQIANKQLDARDPIVGPALNRIADNAILANDATAVKWVTMSFALPPRAIAARMVIYANGGGNLVGLSRVQFFNGTDRVYPDAVVATSSYSGSYLPDNLLKEGVTPGAIENQSWFSAAPPTSTSPQILLFTFPDLVEVTHIRFFHTDSGPNLSRQPKDYEFQFATTSEVSLLDAVDADHWITMDARNGLPYAYSVSPSAQKAGMLTVVPKLTSNVSPAGTAAASTAYDSNYAAWYAFNQNAGDYWHAAAGGAPWWLSYDFGTPTPILSYAMTGYGPDPSYNPKSWTLEGSSDGGLTWDVLDTQTDYALGGARHVFTLAQEANYRAYRVYVTSSAGSAYIVISELELIHFVTSDLAPDTLHGGYSYADKLIEKLVTVPEVATPNLKKRPVVAVKFWWQDATYSDNVLNPSLKLFLRVNDGTPIEWTSQASRVPEFAPVWTFIEVPWEDVRLGASNKITFFAQDPTSGYREYLYFLDTRLDIPTSDSTFFIEYAMPTDDDHMVPVAASASRPSPLAMGQVLKRASGLILADNLNFLGRYELHPAWDGVFTHTTVTPENHLQLAEVRPGSFQKEGGFETEPFTITSALRRSFSSLLVTASGAGVEVWYRGGSSSRATLTAPWRQAESLDMLFPSTDMAWLQVRLVMRAQNPVARSNTQSVSGAASFKRGTFSDLELYVENDQLHVFERGRLLNHDLFMGNKPRNLSSWTLSLDTSASGTASGWAPASGSGKADLVIRQGDASGAGVSSVRTQPFLYEDAALIYVKGTSFSKSAPGRGEIRIRSASGGGLLHTEVLPDLNPSLKHPGASGMAAGEPFVVDVPSLYGQMVYFEIAAVTSAT